MNLAFRNNWFRVANQHGVLPDDLVRSYENIVKGQDGEDEFQEWVERYLGRDYLMLRNIWLTTGGSRVEVDHLVLTPDYWIATEVKNYDADFHYQNRTTRVGQTKLDVDIIGRAETVHNVLQNIANRLPNSPKVVTSLALINEHCRAYVDYSGSVQVLMRCDIRDFLQDIYMKTIGEPFYIKEEEILTYLNQFKTEVSFDLPKYDELNWNTLKTGVFCPKCGSHNIKDKHINYLCLSCSNKETKQDTVLRAINNYCVLYLKAQFTVREISEFLDNKLSEKTIFRVVNDNFEVEENSTIKYYKYK